MKYAVVIVASLVCRLAVGGFLKENPHPEITESIVQKVADMVDVRVAEEEQRMSSAKKLLLSSSAKGTDDSANGMTDEQRERKARREHIERRAVARKEILESLPPEEVEVYYYELHNERMKASFDEAVKKHKQAVENFSNVYENRDGHWYRKNSSQAPKKAKVLKSAKAAAAPEPTISDAVYARHGGKDAVDEQIAADEANRRPPHPWEFNESGASRTPYRGIKEELLQETKAREEAVAKYKAAAKAAQTSRKPAAKRR